MTCKVRGSSPTGIIKKIWDLGFRIWDLGFRVKGGGLFPSVPSEAGHSWSGDFPSGLDKYLWLSVRSACFLLSSHKRFLGEVVGPDVQHLVAKVICVA